MGHRISALADELVLKLAARVFLSECKRSRYFLAPSREEWVGINLLVRDDELPTNWGLRKSKPHQGEN
jgi:hypothetical protein